MSVSTNPSDLFETREPVVPAQQSMRAMLQMCIGRASDRLAEPTADAVTVRGQLRQTCELIIAELDATEGRAQ
jgi:hypothetical protein